MSAMAFFRSARGRAESERARTLVESHLGDIPGDPGGWRPDTPVRTLEHEMESFWRDCLVGLGYTAALVLAALAIWFCLAMMGLPRVHVPGGGA
jgi:hypothetical protein